MDSKNQGKDQEFSDILSSRGILPKWHSKTWDDFTNDPRALAIVRRYLDNFSEALKDGVGIYLWGANGVGKTLLMTLAMKELWAKRRSVRVMTLVALVSKYTSGWSSHDERKRFNQLIQNTEFLVIEEVGKGFSSPNGVDLSATVLDYVIRIRVQMQKPFWITSNIPAKDIKTMYTEDIASMMKESLIEVQVTGEDFRQDIAAKIKEKYK